MPIKHRGNRHATHHHFFETIEPRILLTVFAPDLTYQPAFRPTGATADEQVFAVSKSRYIVAKNFTEGSGSDKGDTFVAFTRVFADGTVDKTFGQKGLLTFDLDVQNAAFTGSRFVVGVHTDTTASLQIYTFNGKADTSVGSGSGVASIPFDPPSGSHWAVEETNLQHTYSDGTMLISVDLTFTKQTNDNEHQLLKLNADGSQDMVFGSGGVATLPDGPGTLNDVSVADDGIYAYVQQGKSVDPAADLLYRLTPNGLPDNSFGNDSALTIAPFDEGFTELSNGKIVFMQDEPGEPDVIYQLNHDGTPDTTFNGTGSVTVNAPSITDETSAQADQNAMYIDSQNRILVATGGTIFRYTTTGTLDAYPYNGTAPFTGFSLSEDDQGRILSSSTDGGQVDERYDTVRSTQLDSNGVAHVAGTNTIDSVTIRRISGDRYQFVENGETTDLSAPKVKSIEVDLFNGDDNITIGATVNSPSTISGGDGDDAITTGSGATVVDAGAGNDSIDATSSSQASLYGGDGNDLLVGSSGSDSIYGQGGNDTIEAGAGDDYVSGGGGSDRLVGEAGNDTLIGGAGNDILKGSVGNDYLSGQDGADSLTGGGGKDTLVGGN